MDIDLHRIPIREVVRDYSDDGEGGVRGYKGKLNIRPPYQREFVYDEKKREAVIQTIRKGFPLNVMYWAVNGDGTFEVLDGQQRTISLCQYVAGDFSVQIDGRPMAFHNLTQPQKDAILDYELMVYHCEGDDKERLDWFETINIAGEKLTEQEPPQRRLHRPVAEPCEVDLLQDQRPGLRAGVEVCLGLTDSPGAAGEGAEVEVRRQDRRLHVGPPA